MTPVPQSETSRSNFCDPRHREQLKCIRPAIDNRPPKPAPHLQLYGRDYFAKKKATTEAAFQDLKMIQSIAKTMTRPYVVPSTSGRGVSSSSVT